MAGLMSVEDVSSLDPFRPSSRVVPRSGFLLAILAEMRLSARGQTGFVLRLV